MCINNIRSGYSHVKKQITEAKAASFYISMIIITVVVALDLSAKIAGLSQSEVDLWTLDHFNKGICVIVGYYATTLIATSMFMSLQQYFFKTDSYYENEQDAIWGIIWTLVYAIVYSAYVVFFYSSIWFSSGMLIYTFAICYSIARHVSIKNSKSDGSEKNFTGHTDDKEVKK